MTDATSFAKLVPGFDFLQGLVKNAGSSMPNMGQWIAPTIDPVELDRRIQELKTVQFWLEQNARMMSATIQALEVQRMTLVTLQGMNVSVGNLQDALKIHVPSASDSAKASTAKSAKPEPTPAEPAEEAAGVVDPMQWWNSLTQQFTELATTAMNAAGEAAQNAAATAASAAQTATEAATTATANAQAAAVAAASDLAKPARRAASTKAKPAEAAEPAAKTTRSRRTAT
jgi:hypothetical protein